MDSKLKKWLKWLAIIELEISSLVDAKDIFWKVQDLIKKNQRIQKPGIFNNYLGETYISHVIIGIRRQIKKNKQSISFIRLLDEICQNPEKVSRKYFVSLQGSAIKDWANKDFDQFCGTNINHISLSMVENDIIELSKNANKLEKYADKRIAHRDNTALKEIVTFGDIDDCIDFMNKLYCKYHLILLAGSMKSLKPSDLGDWMAVFDYPWRD